MSVLQKSLHPEEKYKAGSLGRDLSRIGLIIAAVFLGISLVLGATHGDHWKRFLYAYVVGWAYIFSICVGVFWLVLLHHLVRGRWATAVRRIAEAMSMAFPIVFIAGLGFIIPLLAGYEDLYYWAHPDAHNAELNRTLLHKLGWLSPWSFTVRYVVYGVLYGYAGLSGRLLREVRSFSAGLAYFVVSGILVVVALVGLARRFGRDA